MDNDEFERIKAEEKAHLQKLRDLKRRHKTAQRTASTAKALGSLRNRDLEDETDAVTNELMRDAAQAEARFDLALEGDAPVTGNASDLDREHLAQAEAEALVRQMKVEMGAREDTSMTEAARAAGEPAAPAEAKDSPATGPGTDPDRGTTPTSAGAPLANSGGDRAANAPKTIGRTPPPAEEPPPLDDAKTIGRRKA